MRLAPLFAPQPAHEQAFHHPDRMVRARRCSRRRGRCAEGFHGAGWAVRFVPAGPGAQRTAAIQSDRWYMALEPVDGGSGFGPGISFARKMGEGR